MTTIIAEAGSNHNGSKHRACELVELSHECAASVCKFQFINPDGLYLPQYFEEETNVYVPNKVYHERQKEVLSYEDWKFVWNFSNSLGMTVTASVFDRKGADLLASLGARSVKIASSDLNNYELHDIVSERFPDVIISTGMSSLNEVFIVADRMKLLHPSVQVKYMYCTSLYPSTIDNIDLNFLNSMIDRFGLDNVGFSDHTSDNAAAVMCKTLGISLFEKHFTTCKKLPGFDHAHALEKIELTNYVSTLNALDKITKKVSQRADSVTSSRARRGLYAARDLKLGELITREDILCVRPLASLTPVSIEDLIGSKVSEPIKKFQPFAYDGVNVMVGKSKRKEAEAHWMGEMTAKGMIN